MKRNSSFRVSALMALACLAGHSLAVHAEWAIPNAPTTIIREGDSRLDSPHGVAFSPSGEYVAAANFSGDTITFYKRIGNDGAKYDIVPAFSILGEESLLDHPYDIAFSPDGSRLAVTNFSGHSVTIYAKDESDGSFITTPVAVIQGIESGIYQPATVKYSPVGNTIAVFNYGLRGISLHSYAGDDYLEEPLQVIGRNANYDSGVPDSFDFSSDGKLLAVSCYDKNAVMLYSRLPENTGKFTIFPLEIIRGDESNIKFPRAVSFHPENDLLILLNSEGKGYVNVYRKIQEAFPHYEKKPQRSIEIAEIYDEATLQLLDGSNLEGGSINVAFSHSGKEFAVTQNLLKNQLEQGDAAAALLVYSFEHDESALEEVVSNGAVEEVKAPAAEAAVDTEESDVIEENNSSDEGASEEIRSDTQPKSEEIAPQKKVEEAGKPIVNNLEIDIVKVEEVLKLVEELIKQRNNK